MKPFGYSKFVVWMIETHPYQFLFASTAFTLGWIGLAILVMRRADRRDRGVHKTGDV